MAEPITREDVLRKIDLAVAEIDDSYDNQQRDGNHAAALVDATRAVAQSNIALTIATLMVAENQPLGVLSDVVAELRRLNADGLRTWPQQ